MSKKVFHVYADKNTYVKVHRPKNSEDNEFGCGTIIAVIIGLYFSFLIFKGCVESFF